MLTSCYPAHDPNASVHTSIQMYRTVMHSLDGQTIGLFDAFEVPPGETVMILGPPSPVEDASLMLVLLPDGTQAYVRDWFLEPIS